VGMGQSFTFSTPFSFTYNGAVKTPINITPFCPTGLIDRIDYTYSGTTYAGNNFPLGTAKPTQAGDYIIYATMRVAGDVTCDGYTDSHVFTIDKAPITISSIVLNKVYDGTPIVTSSVINNTGILTIDNSDVRIDRTIVDYIDKNVGSYTTTVNLSLVSNLNSGKENNYYIVGGNIVSSVTGTITSKTISITSAIAASKVYDGNTNAIITGTLTGIVGSEDVNLSGTGVFADKNVNNNIAITSNSTLTGTAISNYTLSQPTGLTANITSKIISITSATAVSKVYDGNTNATITGTLAGIVGSEDVNLSGTGVFADKNVNNNIAVTSNSTLTGTAISNYTLSQPTGLTANITSKTISITSATAASKVYDGNTNATITGTLTGIVGSEDVNLSGTGVFADKNVNNNIAVTSNSTLTGTAISNYTLSQPTGLTANITSKTISITSAIAASKVYDGNTNAIITGTLTGIVGSEDVNLSGTGVFADKNVNNNIAVTSNSTLTGTAISNYTLSQPVGLVANITPVSISINGINGQNKVYDGNNTAYINGTPVYSGLVTGDNFTVSGTPSFLFADKNAGTAKPITVSGYITPSSNYVLSTQPTGLTADITPKLLAIKGIIANNKPFDGTTTASINGTAAYDGLVTADAGLATVQGGPSFNFDNKDAGVNKPITVTGYIAPSSNYVLTQPTGLTASITPAPITIAGITGVSRTYDRTINATVAGTPVYTGLVAGENLTVVGSPTYSFANKNVGTAKPITVSGFTAPNANYTLSAQPTGITADINPKLLTITGSIPDRMYDASKNTPGLNLSIEPILGDIVNISKTGALFDNANAGVNKDIFVTGLSINTGDDGANYYLASTTATLKGTIKPLQINIVAIDATKTELDPDPPFTYQPVSLLGTDVFTGSLSRFPGESPGDYPITIGSLSAGNNYLLNLNSAKLTIKPLVTNYIFEVPNAFTPNLDGTNDVLKIIKNYRVTGMNYFRIYNRTGQLVFETRTLTEGWNGRRMGDLSGNILESDLYIWVAEFTNMNDAGPVKKSGTVLLLK
jgi:gliding motility-associated-like protein